MALFFNSIKGLFIEIWLSVLVIKAMGSINYTVLVHALLACTEVGVYWKLVELLYNVLTCFLVGTYLHLHIWSSYSVMNCLNFLWICLRKVTTILVVSVVVPISFQDCSEATASVCRVHWIQFSCTDQGSQWMGQITKLVKYFFWSFLFIDLLQFTFNFHSVSVW